MTTWQTLILTAVVGGIMSIGTGVATWWITRSRERLDETRRMQRQLLTDLISNRYDLKGDAFTRALNGCAVVFAESPEVTQALRTFHSVVTSSTRSADDADAALVRLVRSMIGYLDLRMGDVSDEFLLTPFNTRPKSAVPQA